MVKNVQDHLPKKAPKRSGKKGIGPLEDGKMAAAEPHEPELLSEANKKRGKTKRLPGLEDSEIEELEDSAREYANLRDDRMNLLKQEVAMKDSLLALMKKHSKRLYKHDGVEVKIVHEEETVRVKILKEKED